MNYMVSESNYRLTRKYVSYMMLYVSSLTSVATTHYVVIPYIQGQWVKLVLHVGICVSACMRLTVQNILKCIMINTSKTPHLLKSSGLISK